MNRKFILFSVLVFLCIGKTNAQAPGGVTAGMTAWFHAEAGTTPAVGALATWTNQAVNPNLVTLTPYTVSGGTAPVVVNNNPVPFNFHSFLQHNNSGMIYIPASASAINTNDVVTGTEGSMMGIGTTSNQLIVVSSQSASGSFDPGRANTGTGQGFTQWGNRASPANTYQVNYAATAVANATGIPNIYGLRVKVGGTPLHQNTLNGTKATGSGLLTRPAGNYRFGIGSFPGYAYSSNKSAEVVCHNRQLTADEFSRVESYFAIKYGITLGTAAVPVDYLSSASIIVWPGNTTYQNNVTGICRDDASGLIQKQSKAVTANSIVSIYNDNTGGTFPAMNVDNVTTFAADQSFAIFGDNNATTALNTCAMNGKAVRMNRIWKMVKTGAVGDVTLAFTATALPATVTTLLVSTDATFPDASTTAYSLSTSGTLKYAVIPSGSTFFTFSAEPISATIDVVNNTCQSATGGSMTGNVSGGLAPISYSWNTNPVQTTATVTNVPAGNYTLTVTQAGGCSYTQNATVINEVVTLTANLVPKDVKCYGEDNGKITVNNTNGTPAYSYSLGNQNNWGPSNVFNNLSEGLYKVYLKDINGCTGNDTVRINQPTPLSLELKNVIDDYCEISSEPNGSVEILLTGGTIPYNVTLNGSNVGPSLKLKGLPENHYTYDVTDNNGCKINDTFSITHVPCCFFFVPNAFTPNMDNHNDVFKIETTGRIRLNKMIIYNRYGQIVWGTFNQGEGWDGTMNGKPVDAGTYYYNIKYTCDGFNGPKTTEVSGDLTLIR